MGFRGSPVRGGGPGEDPGGGRSFREAAKPELLDVASERKDLFLELGTIIDCTISSLNCSEHFK